MTGQMRGRPRQNKVAAPWQVKERKYYASPGQRFSRLTVIRERRDIRPAYAVWVADCVCDCGGRTTVQISDLYKGLETDAQGNPRLRWGTRSCGCLNRETTAGIGREFGPAPGNLARLAEYARSAEGREKSSVNGSARRKH